MDYETVSALSLTYTLQDRFHEESRNGIQSVLQASNFQPGHADFAIHSADIYLQEAITNEEELRATYAQAAVVLRKKLNSLSNVPARDTMRATDSRSSHLIPAS